MRSVSTTYIRQRDGTIHWNYFSFNWIGRLVIAISGGSSTSISHLSDWILRQRSEWLQIECHYNNSMEHKVFSSFSSVVSSTLYWTTIDAENWIELPNKVDGAWRHATVSVHLSIGNKNVLCKCDITKKWLPNNFT